ncbi:MAG: hypothetical protein MUF70_16085 [Myxococcota bacterium]|jgi:hypothetical protein|nr:hypothetical protein [Myxococcota bacterium]
MSATPRPVEDRLVYSREELLDSGPYAAPLIAGGVRCHGGFEADGRYRSPRTIHRAPAIEAWQARLRREGHDLVEIPAAGMPPTWPSVEQSVLLLEHGVRDPIVRTLTIISIVEGFGAIIRDVRIPDLRALVVEPIDGTALAHLGEGLFEAHARDESGFKDEGGHKQMWEAARDLALDRPKIPGDVLMRMMGRQAARKKAERPFPQLDATLERMLGVMAQVLVVEIFAEGTFDWGHRVLSNPKVSAAPEAAGAMVQHIRSDESPHVEYLRTALSEVRARTLRTVDGKTIAGRSVVDALLHRILFELTRHRPQEQRDDLRESLATAMQVAPDPKRLREEFDALDVAWTPPAKTGFEPALTP